MFNLSVAFRFLKEGKSQTALILIGITLGIAVQVFLNCPDRRPAAQPGRGHGRPLAAHHGLHARRRAGRPPTSPTDGRPVLSRIVTNEGSVKPIRNWEPIDSPAGQAGRLQGRQSRWPRARASSCKATKSLPVILRGFDLERADALYDIRRRLVAGRYEVGGNGILIGRELADKLRTGVGASLRITVPGGAADLFPINGVFDLENQALNESWIVISLNRAQILFGLDRGLTQLELQVPDVFTAASLGGRACGGASPP